MTRSRASAKAAGASFNRSIANYLAAEISDVIDVRHSTGAKDKGDISGLRFFGHRLVTECKDYGGRVQIAGWIAEAQIEAINDDALMGFVVAKRRGTTDPAEQIVIMTLGDAVKLLTIQQQASADGSAKWWQKP